MPWLCARYVHKVCVPAIVNEDTNPLVTSAGTGLGDGLSSLIVPRHASWMSGRMTCGRSSVWRSARWDRAGFCGVRTALEGIRRLVRRRDAGGE